LREQEKKLNVRGSTTTNRGGKREVAATTNGGAWVISLGKPVHRVFLGRDIRLGWQEGEEKKVERMRPIRSASQRGLEINLRKTSNSVRDG